MIDLKKTGVYELPLVGPAYAKKLKNLEIESVWDLFHHLPTRFLDFTKNTTIADLQLDEIATVHGVISKFTNAYTKTGKSMQIVTITDETGKMDAMWFNQIYLSNTFKAGKLTWMGRKKAMIAPEYEIIRVDAEQIHTGHLISIYPETSGISSKWLRRKIFDSLKTFDDSFQEFLSQETLEKYNLIGFHNAIHNVHFPKTLEEFEKAKERLAFNELLSLHINNITRKKEWQRNQLISVLEIKKTELNKFISKLPFKLTLSQSKVVDEIIEDLQKNIPMNRLLEGDVGSGKTVVAAIAMYGIFLNGKQSVLMAPTQILANQHYQTLKKLFEKEKVKIGIFTGTKKSNGDFDIIVGTHALLQSKVDMSNVSLFVIDEQHKFGVEQRNILVSKSKSPHVLTMTATPIPRTVALTFFGDLDLSTLDELPKGRQKIITWMIPEIKRKDGFVWIHDQIKEKGVQAFVVCPLIDESTKETMSEVKAANKEFENLQKEFKDLKIDLLHGRLKAREKDDVIEKFKDGKTNILVSTPVVEVGIDIPNATIMVIEAADRFGLASLHQLRGRVGRGSAKSYCLLMTESQTEKTKIRLKAMTRLSSGFQLAELDLKMRGPGEIFGNKQSGIPELKIADWNNIEMIRNTRDVAEMMLNN
jgi:ATP-dependent DNA helicase RecG